MCLWSVRVSGKETCVCLGVYIRPGEVTVSRSWLGLVTLPHAAARRPLWNRAMVGVLGMA